MPEYCCEGMRERAEQTCPDHPNRFDCGDLLIHRTDSGEYGLMVHDGGASWIVIDYCPWCGATLPGEVD